MKKQDRGPAALAIGECEHGFEPDLCDACSMARIDKMWTVVKWAAEQDCRELYSEYTEFRSGCIPCEARVLMGPLQCSCGKYELNWARASLYDRPIYHQPDSCTVPPQRPRCGTCAQLLPDPVATAGSASASEPPAEEVKDAT